MSVMRGGEVEKGMEEGGVGRGSIGKESREQVRRYQWKMVIK